MDLRSAILRASAFASKAHPVFSGIRIKPHGYSTVTPPVMLKTKKGEDVRLPDESGYVMASDGSSGVLIHLDPGIHVPDVLVEGAALTKMLKTMKKNDAFLLEMTGAASVGVRGIDKPVSFHASAMPGSAYPAPPQWPERLERFFEADSAMRVVHYAGDDDERPDLRFLHLTPRFIEASDQLRIARVAVHSRLTTAPMLISRQLFTHWPRANDGVSFGLQGPLAFLYVDEELRFGPAELALDKFYNLSMVFPETHHGYMATLNRMALMQATKFATAASLRDFVELCFSGEEVAVCGLADDGSRHSANVVPAVGATDPVRLVLKGRALWKSLSILKTDEEVDIGYTAPDQPLRIEGSAGFTSCLWPLIPIDASISGNTSFKA